MGKYAVHQVDANAEELYAAARKLGFSVIKTGASPVDSWWGLLDQTVAVEIKTLKGKLRPTQARFFRTFQGMKREVRTVGDVISLYRELRERHERMHAD